MSEPIPRPARPPQWAAYLWAALMVLVTTGVGLLLRGELQVTDIAMLYLLAVVVVATRYRRGPSLLASALSILAFDLGFVEPYGHFTVHEAAFVLTFLVMFVVALVMSGLTTRIREEADLAAQRERRTGTLYDLGRELAGAISPAQVAEVVTRHLGAAVGGQAAFAPADPGGEEGAALRIPDAPPFGDPRTRDAAEWSHAWDLPAGHGTGEFSDLPLLLVPVRAALRRHGVVAIQGPGIETLEETDRRTLELLARQAALTLERLALTEERERTEVAMEAERLRGTLLSSISHDLRTPLASIEGAGTALLEGPADPGSEHRRELLETIVEESRRMTRMVTNLLDMVRVESGALTMHRAWIPIEEVIGVARLRLDALLAERAVQVELPTDPLLVFADEILLEQVLVNLLENAVRYTPPRSPIRIAAFTSGAEVIVEVADRGPGVPEGERERVFRKFHRVAPGDRTSGIAAGTGLGLAICRGVISAHGGRIWVEPHEGGGASFRFALPRATPPAAPVEGE